MPSEIDYEIEILKLNIELYERLRQEFIAEENTLPVEGRTLRFEGLERISGLKTKARQRLAELEFTRLITSKQATGLFDKHGKEIHIGDFVSLNGNMTADDSLGILPNGWFFDESDIYEVYFDERIGKASLKLGVEPDSAYNAKYMNHAVGLLYSGDTEIVDNSKELTQGAK